MEQTLEIINKAKEELALLNESGQEKFKVITADNIDDYLHHYAEMVLIHKRINAALISYMLA